MLGPGPTPPVPDAGASAVPPAAPPPEKKNPPGDGPDCPNGFTGSLNVAGACFPIPPFAALGVPGPRPFSPAPPAPPPPPD